MTGPDFTDRGSPDSPPVSSAPQAAGGASRRIEPRRFAWVDAFTYKVFGGNPAVVVPLDSWPDSKWLQRVANEMNQSDTAFVVANGAGFDLRWFTPVTEKYSVNWGEVDRESERERALWEKMLNDARQ